MGWAVDLLWGVPENNLHAHDGEILPLADLCRRAYDSATPPTLRAATTVFMWLDRQVQFPITVLEPKTGDFHALEA